jgi:hypothetical protein
MKKMVRNYLEAITSKKKRRKFCVYDLESKRGDTREPGFTRPFLAGFFDPTALNHRRVLPGMDNGYMEFRDEPHLLERPWERRHIMPGGCVDKLLSVALSRRYKNYVFYAHNGGNFDHLFMLAWLEERKDEFGFEVVPVQSSIQMVRVWRKPRRPEDPVKERWEFLDSFKLLPFGLDKACKTFGLPGKEEFNLSEHEDHPLWSVYLKQDCIALATVLTKLHTMVEDLGGEVGITTPSTAMRLFRRKYIGQDGVPERIPRFLHWPSCDGKTDGSCGGCMHDWIRRGYYGGRTEIFRFRGSKLRYYDLNSSYVASMKYHMPIGDRIIDKGRIEWRRHHSPENPKGKYSGFAECEVYIPPDCPVPPLPHKSVETGKLIFPSGVFHGVWSVEELALLKDPFVGGEIRKVKRAVWFKLQPMFRQMVEALWKLRDKKRPGYDKGLDELAKLLGNSTYGKFAMKRDRSSVVFARGGGEGGREMDDDLCFLCGEPDEEREIPRGGICTACEGSKPAMKEPEGEVWYKASKSDAAYVIPHVAAHITTLSRITLWRYMKMAVQMGGQVYYSDTDSIITDVELPTSTNLGEMKDEYPDEDLEFIAIQPKVYMISKMRLNQEIALRRHVLEAALSGNERFDASTLDVATRVLWKGDDEVLDGKAKAGDIVRGKDYELAPYSKVTMKGFPPRMRTRANLDTLLQKGKLEWEQLEKVRSLARLGFQRPPKMKNVEKSFKSTYDKRVALPDGGTCSIVLNEPMPVFEEAEA